MGVLTRFERRLEGLVEGAFAKLFKAGVHPVEIAKALEREAGDHRAIGATRTLVPNEFDVALGLSDHARLLPYAESLGAELATMIRESAAEHGWEFVGPVTVDLVEDGSVDTGVFRVASRVTAGPTDPPLEPSARTVPMLRAEAGDTTYLLPDNLTVVGRATDAGVRLNDPGVSRRHAELRREGADLVVVDLGSTNGTTVNGAAVQRARLAVGDRVGFGPLTFVVEAV